MEEQLQLHRPVPSENGHLRRRQTSPRRRKSSRSPSSPVSRRQSSCRPTSPVSRRRTIPPADELLPADGTAAGRFPFLSRCIVSKVDAGSSSSKDDSVPNMKEFLAMIRDSGVSEGTDLMFKAAKLAVKREHRELLAAFETHGGRFDYLERMHDELNK